MVPRSPHGLVSRWVLNFEMRGGLEKQFNCTFPAEAGDSQPMRGEVQVSDAELPGSAIWGNFSLVKARRELAAWEGEGGVWRWLSTVPRQA